MSAFHDQCTNHVRKIQPQGPLPILSERSPKTKMLVTPATKAMNEMLTPIGEPYSLLKGRIRLVNETDVC